MAAGVRPCDEGRVTAAAARARARFPHICSLPRSSWKLFITSFIPAGQTHVRHGRAGSSVHRRRPSQVPQLHVQVLFHRATDGSQTFLYGLRAGRAADVR